MTHWNYRVIRDTCLEDGEEREFFEIHEVYYGKSGKIKNWTCDSVSPYGETVNELIDTLRLMMEAAWHKPVLERTRSGKSLKELK